MPRNSLFSILLLFLLVSCLGETEYEAPECGNGKVESGETCDDGNRTDGDGCSRWCTREDLEDCANGTDDDGDGLVDCADPDCDCPSPEICGNSRDDDGDGLTDCEDPDCECTLPEDCANGLDDDGDDLIDCDDPDCDDTQPCGGCPTDGDLGDARIGDVLTVHGSTTDHLDAPCFQGPEAIWRMELLEPVSLKSQGAAIWLMKEEIPGISCDMDSMGCADSLDLPLLPPGTYRVAASGDATIVLGVPSFEDCTNGWDDDLDGLTDCEDPECQDTLWCPPPEDCTNGVDDDLDGLTDCDDPDCTIPCAPPEDCTNGVDDDLDGRTDCMDMDCIGSSACGARECIINKSLGTLRRSTISEALFSTLDSTNFVALTCGGAGPDYSISFSLDSTATVVVEVFQYAGRHGWALVGGAPQGGVCRDGELFCKDGAAAGLKSSETFYSMPPEDYLVILDTESQDASGEGMVRISVYDPFGEICTNGLDDDGDGLTDCEDPDCTDYVTCAGETDCHGGLDDDGDGLTDCEDPDCMQIEHCAQSSCTPDIYLGELTPGTSLARHITTGDATAAIPCADGPQSAVVLSFNLQTRARVRMRLISENFSEPAMLLSAPAGSWSGCTDAPYMCINVPAAGMSADFTTPDELPPGTYFLTVTPYDQYSTADALVVLQIPQ